MTRSRMDKVLPSYVGLFKMALFRRSQRAQLIVLIGVWRI